MVHIKPDLEAGTAEERAEVPPPPAQYDHYNEDTDEEPDVEDIEVGDWTMMSILQLTTRAGNEHSATTTFTFKNILRHYAKQAFKHRK